MKKTAFLSKKEKKAGWMRSDMSLFVVHSPKVKGTEGMQSKTCSRWRRRVGSRENGVKRDGTGLALLRR